MLRIKMGLFVARDTLGGHLGPLQILLEPLDARFERNLLACLDLRVALRSSQVSKSSRIRRCEPLYTYHICAYGEAMRAPVCVGAFVSRRELVRAQDVVRGCLFLRWERCVGFAAVDQKRSFGDLGVFLDRVVRRTGRGGKGSRRDAYLEVGNFETRRVRDDGGVGDVLECEVEAVSC